MPCLLRTDIRTSCKGYKAELYLPSFSRALGH
jgi:hypothetical protein